MDDLLETRAELLGSLLVFTKVFYKIRTGRDFVLSHPVSRESHYITICRALTRVANGEDTRLVINIPPRYGKTELLIHYAAWILARWPDSNFIYVSYSKTLAARQTQTIREILQLPAYKKLFGVEISEDTKAKDNFKTNYGGTVYAAGAGGTITGWGAGVKDCDVPKGGILIDDIHKPDEATSDVIREGVIDWYYNTLLSRLNSPKTPTICNGQRVHEADLAAHLMKDQEWTKVIIPVLDPHNNPLDERMHTRELLLKMKEQEPYVFAAQYMQDPQPAGGGIFKPEDFYLTNEDPPILAAFITADTAESDKDYNDATVFSFWGIYKTFETGDLALHWIACRELRIEPKDLLTEFMDFYVECCRYKVKPRLAAIEKKSTGTTLVSILKNVQGLQIKEIERTKASGNKTARFLEIQPYIASKLISLHRYGKHTDMCITHCKKITANNSHAHDDIADTLYDAVKLALIDKYLIYATDAATEATNIASRIASRFQHLDTLRSRAIWQ